MASAAATERVLEPLDGARRELLRALGPVARPVVRDRELRVALVGLFSVASALVLAVVWPLWLLALGPILLGVPHLLADVRYLVVRPRLWEQREAFVALVLTLAAVTCWPHAWMGLVAIGASFVWGTRRQLVSVMGLGVVVALYVAARRWEWFSDLAVMHLHNVVGVLLWWAWRPRGRRLHWVVGAAFALGMVAIGAGVFDHHFGLFGGGPATGTPLRRWLRTTAPHGDERWAARAVVSFAFAQSVHYAVWLRLLPDEDRAQPTPRSFRGSFRALHADFGTWPLLATLALCMGLAAWGWVSLDAAREGYLRLAGFHAYLEASVAALWMTGAWKPAAKESI